MQTWPPKSLPFNYLPLIVKLSHRVRAMICSSRDLVAVKTLTRHNPESATTRYSGSYLCGTRFGHCPNSDRTKHSGKDPAMGGIQRIPVDKTA